VSGTRRAEVVGSLLRPDELKRARLAVHAGTMPAAELEAIEDRAVDAAIALQEAAGLDVVTDGEMRRQVFTDPITAAVDGLSLAPAPAWPWRGTTPAHDLDFRAMPVVTAKLRRRRSLATRELAYARARTGRPLKVTLPSPLTLSYRWSPEHSRAAYADPFELFADGFALLEEEIRALAALGCAYIQIDAPELATLVDERQRRATYEARGVAPERMLGEGVEMIAALAAVPGVTFGVHMCRGNLAGRWLSEGGYEAISRRVFPRLARFDVFLFEYDDARSGSFEPLVDVPRDKTVVLGLVSTKRAELEPADALVARIEEASRCFPRDQLAISTQCGFASVVEGNPLPEAAQEAKLRRVAEVARRVWG
jgi:5-methyltetrahydropteroyltriglutamate--homocysteine methyltransferase